MNIRALEAADHEIIKSLWSYCFQDSNEFVDWYFSNRYQTGDGLGVFDGDKLIAMALAIPYSISIRGLSIPAALVAGVSTWPEERGKGIMRHLMAGIDEMLQKKGIAIATLYPFNYGFYRKYGYEVCYNEMEFTVPLAGISPKMPQGFRAERFGSNCKPDLLSSVYDKSMRNTSGYTMRSEDEWIKVLSEHGLENGHVVTIFDGTICQGYALYKLEDSKITCKEWVSATPGGDKALQAYFASHTSTAKLLQYRTPADFIDWAPVDEPRGIVKVEPGCMLKVISPENVIRGIEASMKGEININIDGVQCLKISCNGHLLETNAAQSASATISLLALAQLITGFASANELVRHGSLACNEDELNLLNGWFPKCRTALFERY